MTDATIIPLLIAAVTGLSASVVYLYKRSEKREKEVQQMVRDVLNTILNSEAIVKNADDVLRRVEKLLTNWRGH